MKWWFFIGVLVICLFVENTYLSLPLVFDAILLLYISRKDSIAFPISLGSGFIVDMLSVRLVGITSIFFLVFLIFVMLYERKFEIQTYPFVFFSSFLGSIAYLLLFGHYLIFWQALVNALIVVVVWRNINNKFLISN